MKKLSYILSGLLMLGTSAIFSSCGDNEDFGGPHQLTDDEAAELARQEHIRDSLRNSIDAGLVLEYTADITISASSYDGVEIAIDCNRIADFFGITTEQLLTGKLAGKDNGVDVSGFAIEGSNHADNLTMSTSGAPWGHWWNPDGNVTSWKNEAEWPDYKPTVFTEFNAEEGIMTVGQYPGKLAEGQTIKVIDALKYQDKRVAVVITITGKAREEVKATVVASNKLTLETAPNDAYATVAVEGFDAAAALSALGAGSWADVAWVATNADGSYAQEYSADAPGFWYDKEGFAGSWGDNASVFATFQEGQILIGQMPGQMTEGSSVTINFSAMYNNKIVENIITVNIVGYEDPETAPEGTPASIEKDITLTKPYDADWGATEELDVKEELRQCFKMTTYQIFSALKSGEMKMWVNEIGNKADEETGLPAYTGEAPGWWLNGEGAPVAWGDEAVAYVFLGIAEDALAFYGGNHPENCSPNGQTIKTKYIIEYNGVTATYNITFDITAAQ